MTKTALNFILVFFLLTACGQTPSTATIREVETTPIPTFVEPVSSSPAQNKELLVVNSQDSGPGSLREALQEAGAENIITFDPGIFPPDNPVTIRLLSALPPLDQGQITLDASEVGIILDGSQAGGEWTPGLDIASSGNVVRGLQIAGFSGPGILVRSNADKNTRLLTDFKEVKDFIVFGKIRSC